MTRTTMFGTYLVTVLCGLLAVGVFFILCDAMLGLRSARLILIGLVVFGALWLAHSWVRKDSAHTTGMLRPARLDDSLAGLQRAAERVERLRARAAEPPDSSPG